MGTVLDTGPLTKHCFNYLCATVKQTAPSDRNRNPFTAKQHQVTSTVSITLSLPPYLLLI